MEKIGKIFTGQMYELLLSFTVISDVNRPFKTTFIKYCFIQWISKLPRVNFKTVIALVMSQIVHLFSTHYFSTLISHIRSLDTFYEKYSNVAMSISQYCIPVFCAEAVNLWFVSDRLLIDSDYLVHSVTCCDSQIETWSTPWNQPIYRHSCNHNAYR